MIIQLLPGKHRIKNIRKKLEIGENKKMFNYIVNQIEKIIVNNFGEKIQNNESVKIKLKSSIGETNWMDINQDQLNQIVKVFESD